MRYLALLLLAAATAAAQQPFTADVMMKLKRIGDPQLSPDGKWIAYSVQSIDVEGNKRPREIQIVPLDGGAARRLSPANANADRPRWSPDSTRIYYVSDQGGSAQIWSMSADGSGQRQVTRLSTEAGGVMVSPDGKRILFTSEVYPDCADDVCNKRKLDAETAAKVKARVYTSLLYRRWNQYRGARVSHLFAMTIEDGSIKDLTPGPRDVPGFSLGGPDDYAISPDGKEVCYALNLDETPAISTNSDLFVVPIEGGEAKKITVNPGADNSPVYSPDGKYLAYRAQFRAGYESDRWRLLTLDRTTGQVANLTDGIDRHVNSITWTPDSQRLFFTVEDRGRQQVQYVPAGGGAARVAASGDSTIDDVQLTADGKTMVFTEQSGAKPVEIYRVGSSGGTPVALTHLNDAVLNANRPAPFEEFTVDGADGAKVHGFLVKPHGFDPAKKYPAIILIHGGPQGHWGQSWTYRWNPQVFAAAGYVVAMPNPRGSTGYGSKFTDEINSDWGGKAYADVMAATDHIAGLPYVDRERIGAAGGSYGGYMVNWILGHTTRYKALISHAGVFDLRSEAGETEELWFPIWEFGGMPWTDAEAYNKWSPSHFVKEFKTPTLVIHGELDYRVPVGQGHHLFTSLQLQKVPSKLILFPDEGHWILKPQNSLFWYKNFVEWMDQYLKK